MIYKNHEIIGISNIASYSTLEDNGHPDAYITEFGEHGQLNEYTFVQGSPFDIEEDQLDKYQTIADVKKAIDQLIAYNPLNLKRLAEIKTEIENERVDLSELSEVEQMAQAQGINTNGVLAIDLIEVMQGIKEAE